MNTLKSKLPPMGTLGPFIALIVACIFFSLQSDRFLSLQNFSLILQQVRSTVQHIGFLCFVTGLPGFFQQLRCLLVRQSFFLTRSPALDDFS